jgi:hypothetical protein
LGDGAHCGFTSINLIAVLGMVLLCAVVIWALGMWRHQARCRTHLRQLYHLMQMYELQHGSLPELAFFPDRMTNEGSLHAFIEAQDVDPDLAFCPALPHALRRNGQSYIWNDALNGSRLAQHDPPRWMLMEYSVVSDRISAPHAGAWHVLFTDGTVQRLCHSALEQRGILPLE